MLLHHLHRGEGVEDNRPLIQLENARSVGSVTGDMIAEQNDAGVTYYRRS